MYIHQCQVLPCDTVKRRQLKIRISEQTDPLLHVISLPRDAQYLGDIKICSHPVLLGSEGPAYKIYTVQHSIEKVCFGTSDESHSSLSELSIYPPQPTVAYLSPVYQNDLNFWNGRPFLLESAYKTIPTIFIKFKTPPCSDYWLDFQLGWINSPQTRLDMKGHEIIQECGDSRLRYFEGMVQRYRI